MDKRLTALALLTAFAAPIAAQAADAPVLKFAIAAPPRTHMIGQVFEPWCERVVKEAGDTVGCKIYAGGVLSPARGLYDAVKNNVAEIAFLSVSYWPNLFEKSSVVGLPFEIDKSEHTSIALWRIFEQGLISDEYKDFRTLALFAYPETLLHTNVPVRTLEDLRGKKIGTLDKVGTEVLAHLGATPFAIQFTDVYTSIQSGLIQGNMVQWTAMQPLKLWEVAKYHTQIRLGGSNAVGIILNKETYAKLGDKAKAAIDKNSGLKYSHELGVFWDKVNLEGRQMVEAQKDNTIFDLNAAEQARWHEKLKPMEKEWVARVPNGAAVLAGYRAARDAAAKGM
jgi:TRAP-type C4-dicarboxylate transport system substrate-binding protein